jgi:hypothetical protein
MAWGRKRSQYMATYLMHHLLESGAVSLDLDGYERSNLSEMRVEAVAAARELMADRILSGRLPGLDDRFVVTESSGPPLFTLTFKDAVSAEAFC